MLRCRARCIHEMRAWLPALLELPRTRSAGAASQEGGVLVEERQLGLVHRMGDRMSQRDWVKSVGKKLRDDMGDCPTLPQEMLDLLTRLRAEHSDSVWGGTTLSEAQAPRGVSARGG